MMKDHGILCHHKLNDVVQLQILVNLMEPAPLNMPHEHTGDLCQECIGHCYLKVWANVLKIPKGQQEKEFCINRCNLECTELD